MLTQHKYNNQRMHSFQKIISQFVARPDYLPNNLQAQFKYRVTRMAHWNAQRAQSQGGTCFGRGGDSSPGD